jgi:hypothetical protein
MVSRYGGHVVNVSGHHRRGRELRHTLVLAALTTGGLAATTRSLAAGYASPGILINVWHPALSRPRRNSYRRPGGRFPPLGRGGQ